jgi:hypothetical protein
MGRTPKPIGASFSRVVGLTPVDGYKVEGERLTGRVTMPVEILRCARRGRGCNWRQERMSLQK